MVARINCPELGSTPYYNMLALDDHSSLSSGTARFLLASVPVLRLLRFILLFPLSSCLLRLVLRQPLVAFNTGTHHTVSMYGIGKPQRQSETIKNPDFNENLKTKARHKKVGDASAGGRLCAIQTAWAKTCSQFGACALIEQVQQAWCSQVL